MSLYLEAKVGLPPFCFKSQALRAGATPSQLHRCRTLACLTRSVTRRTKKLVRRPGTNSFLGTLPRLNKDRNLLERNHLPLERRSEGAARRTVCTSVGEIKKEMQGASLKTHPWHQLGRQSRWRPGCAEWISWSSSLGKQKKYSISVPCNTLYEEREQMQHPLWTKVKRYRLEGRGATSHTKEQTQTRLSHHNLLTFWTIMVIMAL